MLVLLLVLALLVTGLVMTWVRDGRTLASVDAAGLGHGPADRAGARAVRTRRGAGAERPRARRQRLEGLARPHRPGGQHAEERPRAADRDRQRARPLLARRDRHLRRTAVQGRRRGRLRTGPPALPRRRPRRAARPRLLRSDRCRPRHPRPRAVARAARRVARGRTPKHCAVAPSRAPRHGRAHRPADDDRRRRRVRDPQPDRLDVVHSGHDRAGAAARRMGRRARPRPAAAGCARCASACVPECERRRA